MNGFHFSQSAPVSAPEQPLTERVAALEKQNADLLLALQDAYEAAAQVVENLHPYVFVGHMNDYRRNQADAAKAIRALKRTPTAANAGGQQDDELRFNATRLRNVAKLVGLGSAVPQDDATLDWARGSVLGMIAGKLRATATSAGYRMDPAFACPDSANGCDALCDHASNTPAAVGGADELPWVSVTERLPEQDADVLVYRPHAADAPAFDPTFCIRNYIGGGKFSGEHAVTHWLPLHTPAAKGAGQEGGKA